MRASRKCQQCALATRNYFMQSAEVCVKVCVCEKVCVWDDSSWQASNEAGKTTTAAHPAHPMPVPHPLPTTDPPPPLTLTLPQPPQLTTCPLLGSLPSRIPTGNTCCLWISQKHCKFFVISSVRAFYKVASGNVASIHQPHPIPPSLPSPALSLPSPLAVFMPSTTQQFIVRIFLHHAAEAQTTWRFYFRRLHPASYVPYPSSCIPCTGVRRWAPAGCLQPHPPPSPPLPSLSQELSAQLVDCLHLWICKYFSARCTIQAKCHMSFRRRNSPARLRSCSFTVASYGRSSKS